MGSSASDNDDEITGINVTPLVDVMLVLLVIFMVTATYIVNQSIDVNLPKADTGSTLEEVKNLGFVLDRDSRLYLNGKEVGFEQLPLLIEQEKAKKAKGQLQALISADQATPHGAVVKLIDVVRKNGITDFAINVEASE